MNSPSLPLPKCPNCTAPMLHWPRRNPIYGCTTCLRPMVLLPAKYQDQRVYRIHKIFDVAKYLTAFVAMVILLGLATNLLPMQMIVAVTVVTLLTHGSMDLADGILGIKTRIDNSRRQVRYGKPALGYATAKIAAGLGMLALALLGMGV